MGIDTNIDFLKSIKFIHNISTWLREGLYLTAPVSLRNFKFKDLEAIKSLDGNSTKTTHMIRQSLLGQVTIVPCEQGSEPLPVTFNLTKENVFLTEISLPMAAKKNIRAALNLRLNKICPLPQDQVLYDYEILNTERTLSDKRNRFQLRIAFVKKSTIFALQENLTPENKSVSFGFLHKTGHFYRFDKATKMYHSTAKNFLMGSVLLLSFVILISGLRHHQGKTLSTARMYQAELVTHLKSTTQKLERKQRLSDAMKFTGEKHTIDQNLQQFSSFITQVPSQTLLEKAHFKTDKIQIEGYIQNEDLETLRTSFPNIALKNVMRPGWQYFSLPLKTTEEPNAPQS